MAGSIIGKVSVKVWPDTRGFKKEAEAGLKGQEPSDVDVGIDADVKKALAKIEALERRIKKAATVDVDADTAGAAAKAKALKKSIEAQSAKMKVDTDVDKALARAQRDFEKFDSLLVRVKAQLDKDTQRDLKREMDTLLHRRERLNIKIGVETDRFKIKEMKRDLHDVDRSILNINRNLGRMASGAHRAHEGFVRVERSVGRVQRGIGRAFGEGSRNNFLNTFGRLMGRLSLALTAPILALGLLGRGITDGIGKFRDLAAEGVGTGKALVGGLGAAFMSITQSSASLIAAITGAGLAFASLAIAVPFITMLTGAITALVGTISIGLVGSLIPLIPLFGALGVGAAVAGGAIWAISDDIKKGTGHFAAAKRELGGLKKALQDIGRQAAPALGRIGATMIRGATALAKSMSGAVNAIFRDFDREIRSPKMDKFYDQWQNKMPGILSKFGQGLNSLAVGLIAFFTPALDIADDLAQKFKNAMDRFKEWTQSAEGQNSIADFFEKAWDRAKTLWSVIKHLSKSIANLFSSGDEGAGKGFLESWEKSLEKFEKWTSNPKNTEKFWEDVKQFGTDLKDITKDVADFFEELNKPENRKRLSELMGLLDKFLAILQPIGWLAEHAANGLVMFGRALEGIGKAFTAVKDFFKNGGLGGDDLLPDWMTGEVNLDGMKNLGPRIMGFLNQIIPQVAGWAIQMNTQFFGAISGWVGQIAVSMGLVAQAFLGPLMTLPVLIGQTMLLVVNSIVLPLISLPMRVGMAMAGLGLIITTSLAGLGITAATAMFGVVTQIVLPLASLPMRVGMILAGLGITVATSLAGLGITAATAMFGVVTQIILPLISLPGRAAMALAGMGIAVASSIAIVAAQAGLAAAGIGIQIIGQLISIPGRAAATLVGLGPSIMGAISTAAGMAAGAALSLVGSVIGILGSLPGRAAGAISGLTTTISGIMVSAMGAATSLAGSLVSGVVGILSGLPSGAAGAISGITGALSGIMSSTLGAMVGLAGSIVSSVVAALSPLPQQAAGAVLPIVMELTSIGQRTMEGLAGAIAGGIGAVMSAAGEIPGAITGAVGDLSSLLVQTGKDVVNGLVSGIESRIGSAERAAGKLAGIVKSVASMRLEVRSPSRVFMAIGGHVVDGLAIGLGKTAPVARAAGDLGLSALHATRKALDIHSPSRAFQRVGTQAVAGATKGIKKKEKVDRRDLIAAGRRMIKSFGIGMRSQAANIKRYIGAAIDQIPKMTNVMARKWAMANAKQLKSDMVVWERLRKQYDEWRDKMTELRKAKADFASGMVDNALGIAGLGNIEGGFNEVIHRLTTARKMTDEFAKHLQTLRRNGLREDLYEDIASMGAEQGLAAAKAIAEAGKKGVQQVNALQTDLLKSASSVGNRSASYLYNTGIDMATSMANGFAKEMNKVEMRMMKIARNLAQNINSELKSNGLKPVVESIGVRTVGGGSYSTNLNSGSTNVLNYYAAPGTAMSTEQELFKAFKKAGF